jgi:hypothetical protein
VRTTAGDPPGRGFGRTVGRKLTRTPRALICVAGAAVSTTGRGSGRRDVSGAVAKAGQAADKHTKIPTQNRLIIPFQSPPKVRRIRVLSSFDNTTSNGAGAGKIVMQMFAIARTNGPLQGKQLFGEPTQDL